MMPVFISRPANHSLQEFTVLFSGLTYGDVEGCSIQKSSTPRIL